VSVCILKAYMYEVNETVGHHTWTIIGYYWRIRP